MDLINLNAELSQALGVTVGHCEKLGGGDFAQSWKVKVLASQNRSIEAGGYLFVKTHSSPPPYHFTTEAIGLEKLRQVEELKVPAVLAVSDEPGYLALEWIEEGSRERLLESDLAMGMAALHKLPCAVFGREDERSTGALALPNYPCRTWAKFYSTQRLLPLIELAREYNSLDEDILSDIEKLCGRLGEFIDDSVAASYLHGDLWAGNRLVDREGYSWVIDPAFQGGHREFDLAMMRLFGGFGREFFDAYQEIYPLDPGWESRIPLHQLAPLMVHAIKFGRAYIGPTRDALKNYV